MESSMGQMSNQWEREGHAKKLAATVMRVQGGWNLQSNFYKEYPVCAKAQISGGCLSKISHYAIYNKEFCYWFDSQKHQ